MAGLSRSIHDVLEEQAKRDPKAAALLAPWRKPITYYRLLTLVEETVQALNAAGIRRGDRVAVVLSNGPEMAASFLAVASSTTCAPLNPAYRASEFEFYLSDLKPRALIVESETDSPANAVAKSQGIPIIELSPRLNDEAGVFSLKADRAAGAARPVFGQADDVALVLHTSGTTSRPKMVPLTHSILCHSAYNVKAALELTAGDRCLNVMPLFHIHGLVGALLSSMAAGGSLVCTPGFYAPRFFEWIEEFRPTWYTAVPTMHQAILARAAQNQSVINRCPLRLIRSSSSALPPSVMAALEDVFQAPVIESYGMTEASHQMTSNPVPPGRRKPGSVGVAAGPSLAIMDEDGKLLEPGHNGEIVVRGANIMRDYENNPTANESTFVKGWFRTGDRGWIDSDGFLFITGRTKEVINRGGEKISPREVDEVLLEHPGVAQAVAFALPDGQLGEDVGAAVVLHEHASVSEIELREFAARRLVDFKVPRRVVFLKEIPKGPTGKVQRIGLASKLRLELSPPTAAASVPFRPPCTPTEELLCRMWREVLRLERVGVDDNFFEMGGDSMLATQLNSRLRQAIGVELSLLRLFQTPTVAGLATWLDSRNPSKASLEAPLTRVTPRDAGLPLSFAQQRMWFLAQYEENPAACNRPAVFRIEGPLNVRALEQSVTEIVARHEALRTTFHDRDGTLIQLISPAGPLAIPVRDLSSLGEAERMSRARQLAVEEAHEPFDLSSDLMLRAVLLRLREEEHLLLLTMHHIASDGWSARVLLRELGELYTAFVTGRPPALPELSVQYADFAMHQREWLQGAALEEQLAYWRECLDGSPAIFPLPTDRPRPARQTHRGRLESLRLPSDFTEAIKQLSRQQGVTLFMTLLGAFQTLLYRYTGTEDIVVGSPVANRVRLEAESLIGPFVNTLVLRTDLSGNPTFRELLDRVREVTVGAHAHQDLPFEKLVEALQPARSLSYSPLFQVMFQLRNLPLEGARLEGLKIEEAGFDSGITQFDFTFEVTEDAEGLRCQVNYNTDLFEAGTIRRMLGHYRVLLEGIVGNPDEHISKLPLLTPAERHQLLVEWNSTTSDYPHDRCVHELFEAQVERTPDAVALMYEGRELTYLELNNRANQLAHHLRSLGVGPEVLVGLHVERSLEMVVGVLAILKAGGAYVPLDPAYPLERLALMVEDAGVKLLLTQTKLQHELRAAQAVCLDKFWETQGAENQENLAADVKPENLAYAIYTSGSTGKPKGALITHVGLVNYLDFLIKTYALHSSDIVLQLTSFSFDASVREIIGPLVAGAREVVVSPDDARDPAALVSKIKEQRVTCLLAVVPSMLRELVSAARDKDLVLDSVRVILASGEVLSLSDCKKALEVFADHVSLVNQYGPAECTMVSSYYPITELRTREGTALIGRPVLNCRMHILDEHLNPVPIGVPGELHIGGVGLARGYLNLPELTAAKFIHDPFGDEPGARLYKTGDLGRYLPDGNIEFLGRRDNQVKIRGFRVELGEIETLLSQHPAVRETVVVARDDAPEERRLVAYTVVDREPAPAASELRSYLTEKLPDYMVPSSFVMTDSIPRLPNGKADRRALRAPDQTRPDLAGPFVPPRTPVEEVLAGTWAEVLRLERVGVHDNFFELGGHSLLATRVMSRLRQAFQMDLPLRHIFEAPTVAGLAASILRDADDQLRVQRTAQLWLQLAHLSEDEVERMLAEEVPSREEGWPK